MRAFPSFLFFLVFLLLALAGPAAGTPAGETAKIDEAVALAQGGDPEAGLRALEEVLKENPVSFPAFFHRGMIRLSRNEIAPALEDFNRTIELNPLYAPAHLGKGRALFQEGHREAALRELEQALAIDPAFGLAYYNLGILKQTLGDYEGSLRDLKKAAELGVEVESDLYEAAWSMTHLDEIWESSEAAIEKDPKDGDAYHDRGLVRFYRKDYAGALDDLNRAESLGTAVERELMREVKQAALSGPEGTEPAATRE
ncbi:MAG: tetratricopeptide repeat protein [Candidatus Omnitrophota bacterium]